jgi:hypothetical protein
VTTVVGAVLTIVIGLSPQFDVAKNKTSASLSRLADFELAPVDHPFMRHLSNMEVISNG